MEEFWAERYELVTERIRQIKAEQILPQDWQDYFVGEAAYIDRICEYFAFVQTGEPEKAPLKELKERNNLLDRTCKNPQGECAPLMELLSGELGCLGFLATQGRLEEFLIRLELFAEIYGICVYEWQEEKRLPTYKTVQECLYWYVNDYADTVPLKEVQYLQNPEENPIYQLLQKLDLDGEKCLYRYGTLITDRERSLWEWMVRLSEEENEAWAENLTEEIMKQVAGEMATDVGQKILLQYPVGYEKVVFLLMQKLREQDVEAIPQIAGTGVLLKLYEEECTERKVLWDRALAKRCKEIKQTVTEKAEKEKLFCTAKVVLKEEKNDILKPHVVLNS